jgi:hypothetical protein
MNPFSNNHFIGNTAGTLDVYANEEPNNNYESQMISSKQALIIRPNTTSLDQLISSTSPKRMTFVSTDPQKTSHDGAEDE